MSRKLNNWLTSYLEYACVLEAPERVHFWSGVSALAGAVRRKVWIDMRRFAWYPSFYIIIVAPPGVIGKSTTADVAMSILKEVPGIKFGPNSITWQALVTAFANASESFFYPEGSGIEHPMSPLTFSAAELGSLINMQDRDMINLLIEMWDGKRSYEKITKTSGNDAINAPWINIIGCTTPHWVADTMPQAAIGGGFSSRCVFIYADRKERYVALPDEAINDETDGKLRESLIHDLEHISMALVGPFTINEEARAWTREWYQAFWESAHLRMDNQMLEGYAARKQTHMFKLAMMLSVAERDDRVITQPLIEAAEKHLALLEPDMTKVFSRVGRSEQSLLAEKFIELVEKAPGITVDQAYTALHSHFPDIREFDVILTGAIRSQRVEVYTTATGTALRLGRTNV